MATKRAQSRTKTAKSRSKSRSKSGSKSRAKGRAKASKAAGGDALDRFIDAAAQALALPVEPAWKPAVRFNLDVTLYAAGLFADFPLPDDAEPAPVFVA
jgi:1-carboxybiuret hydrolase subunit AtzG-like protein